MKNSMINVQRMKTDQHFHLFLDVRVVDLPLLPIRSHSSLVGHFVSAHLKPDDIPPFFILLFVALTRVGCCFLWPQSWSCSALLLGVPSKSNDRRQYLQNVYKIRRLYVEWRLCGYNIIIVMYKDDFLIYMSNNTM